MKRYLFALLICTTPCLADDWALTDPASGWNKQGLAVRYHHNSELQTEWAFQVIGSRPPAPTERILDFGCGNGRISALLSQMAYQGEVVGVDIAEEMVTFAKQIYRYPNLRFVQSKEINFSAGEDLGSFDRITSFCVFHLIPQPEETLKALRGSLKAGGELTATWPIRARPEFYQAVREEMGARGYSLPPPTANSQKMRNADLIPCLFEGAGLEVASYKVVESRTQFASEERLAEWLAGTCAAQWEIPLEDQLSFSKALTKRYLDHAPDERDDGGVVSFTLSRAEVVALRR